jgi:hypothetical protein
VGNDVIQATYSGDALNAPSSGTIAQTVIQPQLKLASDVSSISIVGGSSGTAQLTLTAKGGTPSAAATLACTGLPDDANCTFSPHSITEFPASVTVTINTTSADAKLLRTHGRSWLFVAMLLPGILLVPAGSRKRRQAAWMLGILVVVFALSLAGCGGGSGSGGQTYTATITASATGSSSASTTITVTVNHGGGGSGAHVE